MTASLYEADLILDKNSFMVEIAVDSRTKAGKTGE
jgi:hypothetical protein